MLGRDSAFPLSTPLMHAEIQKMWNIVLKAQISSQNKRYKISIYLDKMLICKQYQRITAVHTAEHYDWSPSAAFAERLSTVLKPLSDAITTAHL